MSEQPKPPFTPEEAEISRLIAEAHNLFCKLESQHPDEGREWCDAIHNLQNVLGWRVLRREFPFDFPIAYAGGIYVNPKLAYPDMTVELKNPTT